MALKILIGGNAQLSNTANWYGNQLPTTGDDVLLKAASGVPITTGLADFATCNFNSVTVPDTCTDAIGLTSPPTYAVLPTATLVAGGQEGLAAGPGIVQLLINLSTVQVTATILGTAIAPVTGNAAIWLLANHTSSVFNINGGTVAVALEPGSSTTLGTLNVNSGAQVVIGRTVTCPAAVVSGTLATNSSLASLTINGGSVVALATAAMTAITMVGGKYVHNSGGNVGTLAVTQGATADFSGDPRAKTITTITVTGAYLLKLANGIPHSITVTNPINPGSGTLAAGTLITDDTIKIALS